MFGTKTRDGIKLTISDKIPLIAAVIAALPFHILFAFGLLKAGITLLTFLYLCLNIIIVYCMYKYLHHLFKEKNIALRTLFFYELIPALLISLLLIAWGKSNRPLSPKFKQRMERYFSGRHGR